MIRIHLSRLMGEHKEKLSDLMRSTGLARNTCSGLYHETTSRLDIETLNAICRHYECHIADLIEYVPDPDVGDLDDEVPPNKTASTRHGGEHA
jgi:putative transcriptional regulator